MLAEVEFIKKIICAVLSSKYDVEFRAWSQPLSGSKKSRYHFPTVPSNSGNFPAIFASVVHLCYFGTCSKKTNGKLSLS